MNIIVNGIPHTVDATEGTYDWIVGLAGKKGYALPTVTAQGRHKPKHGLVLEPGDVFPLEEGMIFNVYDTSLA